MEKKIVLNVEYDMTPENARAFVAELEEAGVLADIATHEGYLKYTYYLPLKPDDKLLLIEWWASQEALAKHAAQPCMATLRAIKEKYATGTAIHKYTEYEG